VQISIDDTVRIYDNLDLAQENYDEAIAFFKEAPEI
jgi:hypothetical protein